MFNLAKPLYPIVLSAAKSNPEKAHQQLLQTLRALELSRHSFWGSWLETQLQNSFCFQDEGLEQKLWGLNFANPLGLAPGCDKDGVAAGIWSSFGFGFAELGAVTLHPQSGNPQPRLFRLDEDKAALNRLGANNLGAKVMAQTLEDSWKRKPRQIPIGINLCKSKITSLETAAADYLESFRLLRSWADYFAINVSSPNTPGLRALQDDTQLEPILAALQGDNQGKVPILIKISPDLNLDAIASIIHLAQQYQLAGIIATNTTVQRDMLKTQILPTTGKPITEEAGGISGAPLKERSTEIIRFIFQQTSGKLPIIGVGGIFSSEDAWEKITAGASLLQVYTGWIYQGPWLVTQILQGLREKLAQEGLFRISDAIGYKSSIV